MNAHGLRPPDCLRCAGRNAFQLVMGLLHWLTTKMRAALGPLACFVSAGSCRQWR